MSTPTKSLEIWVPAGVIIDLNALPGVELLGPASLFRWQDSPPHDQTDIRCVVCRDRETLLRALDLELSEQSRHSEHI
jgi:hypothetical protein